MLSLRPLETLLDVALDDFGVSSTFGALGAGDALGAGAAGVEAAGVEAAGFVSPRAEKPALF